MYTVVLKHRSNTIDLFTQGEQFYFKPANGDVVITDATLECQGTDLIITGLQRTYDFFPAGLELTPSEYEKCPISKERFTKKEFTDWCISKEFPFFHKTQYERYVMPRGWANHENSQRVNITVSKADFCIHDFTCAPNEKICDKNKVSG